LGSRAVEILDLEGTNHANCYWVKPSCRHGVIPANGMLYVPPNPCQCQITEMLHGFNALVARGVPERFDESRPLVRGPAYGQIRNPKSEIRNGDDWPTFRHDSRRSGTSAMAGPGRLKQTWSVEIGERPVQPVAAAGRLLVPCREGQRLDCLDAASGRRHWSFFAGGRIDSPPTVRGGAAYFGSADGWVYCLRLSDGRLAWKFRAAPAERRIVSRGRLESAWPVHGSPLLLESPDGTAAIYFAAGRSSHLDGGIHLYGLDPRTGKQLHHAVVRSGRADVDSRRTPRPIGTLSDVLVTDGERIFMRNLAFDRRLKRVEDPPAGTPGKTGPPRLSAWGGLLEDSTWNRTFWMYARGWPTHYANQAPRSGQLLAFDGKTTYALKYFTTRNFHSPMYFPATTGYLLVADTNSAQPYLYDGKPGSKKPVKWLPEVHKSQEFVYDHPVTRDPRDIGYTRTVKPRWMKYLPIRARAMVATGDKVYVAGPPDVLRKGDELAIFEGRAGGRLRTVAAASGETIQELKLESPPVFDGMIAAYGRIYVATEDGKLHCLAEGGQ
jgi:outer membrane protein assembly factor BamB